MNCLSHGASYSAAVLRGTRNFLVRSSSFRHQAHGPLTCKTNFWYLGVKTIDLDFPLNRFRVECYSSRRSSTAKTSRSRKINTPVTVQDEDEFFVVRKGDIVGVYKSLTECQAQVGSSICHPPVSVYKGYSLPKDTEEYLVSHGLKNAVYTIRSTDLTEGLFGSLTPCPFQEPASKKRSEDMIEETPGSTSVLTEPLEKHIKLDHDAQTQAASSDSNSCVIEFDGASKGNPGPAGAAAVLRTNDGSLICKLREGVGISTNNVAEYRALILGMKYALQKGYTNIQVRGDSLLVCKQVLGSWKAKNQNMSDLCVEAKQLKDRFLSFQISHVLRDLNSEADAQANLAIQLGDGEVAEDFE